jgi:hypothetical protein
LNTTFGSRKVLCLCFYLYPFGYPGQQKRPVHLLLYLLVRWNVWQFKEHVSGKSLPSCSAVTRPRDTESTIYQRVCPISTWKMTGYRFRFGLNECFGANYRLNSSGFSPLFLVVHCICLLCLHFVSLGAESAPLSLSTECIRLLYSLFVR